MSAADEAARAVSERYYPDSQYAVPGFPLALRSAFGAGARWQRSQPVEVTEAMVEAGARAMGEFVTHAPVRDLESPNGNYWVREARTVLRAALNTMKGDNS